MPETMLAAVFEGEGRLTLKDLPVPRIQREDDVLLEVLATGICGTDLHILSTPPGHPANPNTVLGHEYTARVIEVGSSVDHLAPGDHVVIDPNLTCGYCTYCRMGYPNSCENMTTLGIFIDGGLAGYNVAPARTLHKISAQVPPAWAAFAEPLSCVVNGTNKASLRPGESVVVLGAGPIGLLFVQMFKIAGARKIIVSEVSDARSQQARALGADVVINPMKDDLSQSVHEETGIGADVVVDSVGSLFAQALQVVRLGGRVILFGMNQNAEPPIRQFDITRREITVMGTYIALHTFPQAVSLIESGLLRLDDMITHRLPLHKVGEGIAALRSGEATKVIVIQK